MSLHTDEFVASSPDADRFSRFTYHDLKSLSRYVTSSPLRVIALIDFDAFYAQCETVRLGLPADKPLAVVQFTNVIALNYAAKAAGLKRIISPEDAKLKCPEVVLQHVATWREGDTTWAYRSDAKENMRTDKAALDPYRKESRKAFDLIKSLLPATPMQKVEKASIDEVFVDLSSHVHRVMLDNYPLLAKDAELQDLHSCLPAPPGTSLDWQNDKVIDVSSTRETSPPDWDDIAINIGAEIVRGLRAEIFAQLKYTCSAGVSHNKVVAKLAAGHNKPNQQTVVRKRAVTDFLTAYKFTNIRGLGGKLGHRVKAAFDTDEVSDLVGISVQEMRAKLGSSSGSWVYNVIRGIEHSEVVERTQLQSMLAAKTFIPKAKDLAHAEKWLWIFAGDLMGRLEEQDATSSHRRPRVIAVHHAIDGRSGPTRSKQMQIPPGARLTAQLLFDMSRELLIQLSHEGPTWPCLVIHVDISNFEEQIVGNHGLKSYFLPKADGSSTDVASTELSCISATKRKEQPFAPQGTTSVKRLRLSSPGIRVHSETTALQMAEPAMSAKKNMKDTDGSGYSCPKCHTRIPDDGVLEHLDWHFALELQND